MKADKTSSNPCRLQSGGLGVKFAGLELGEIGGRGTCEALFAVNGGEDLVIRKTEPIFRREVLQTSHFAELEQRGCFLHVGFAFRFAGGLEGLKHSPVLLERPVDALLVNGEQLELLRLEGENVCSGEGCVDLGDIGARLAAILKLAEGEEIVFDGAGSVETPAVGGDALGELCFHGSLGCEVLYERFGE